MQFPSDEPNISSAFEIFNRALAAIVLVNIRFSAFKCYLHAVVSATWPKCHDGSAGNGMSDWKARRTSGCSQNIACFRVRETKFTVNDVSDLKRADFYGIQGDRVNI